MIHIYPVNDEQDHVLEGVDCPCNPTVNWEDEETGEIYAEPICIHNAFDCREIVEEAERLLIHE